MEKLMRYDWPGNVRELEGVIQRALTFADGLCIQPKDVDIPAENDDCSQSEGMRGAKSQAVGQFERTYLINLLARSHGNVSQAAKTAGKERRTFQRLLRKHGLSGNVFRNSLE
jgi:DNA-binding NtrC family response regulator